ncbi:putative arginine N-methyltransferase [Talaromyces proteolyticus]|uniref:Arginine N-methyltransferase 2 n=1 Tax=Talaromyces proteolyticus TaxID=1131652 RepID=A0AAD4L1A2_9EURO|nr:putative arginine N-methyltransferase [Talaromyces proteolyticus]KAH8704760.1 putative arginine N-methyltransferase [Talaromyces proteolyticus]
MTDTDIHFETIDVDLDIQEILLAASQHDIPKLRQLIRSNNAGAENPVNVKDPETGFSPLHAAIAACEQDDDEATESAPTNGVNGTHGGADETLSENEVLLAAARDMVKFLLQEGGIWNDLDKNNETPGCLARRLGLKELYDLMVDAGVRAELLLNYMEGYEKLEEDDDDDDEEVGEAADEEERANETSESNTLETTTTAAAAEPNVSNNRYLQSNLTFQNDRLLDNDQNGVMMAWESDIMAKTARKLLPTEGLRVLNIGHGMGIVDGFFQDQKPSVHHIVEAHGEVVAEMKRKGWHETPGVVIHEGRWQDILPTLVEQGEMFDAIYYDTFAESYADFREFLSEQVIGLLGTAGQWSFFNGMGADRQISYDVYQKVVEMDVFEAGFDVEWEDIPVPQLEGEWNGVRRRYWVVDNYRLPICKYMD